MLKWIINGLLLFLLYKLVTGGFKSDKPSVGDGKAGGGGADASPDQSGELVEDPQCNVYLPKESAIYNADGVPFCSQECLQAHAAKGK